MEDVVAGLRHVWKESQTGVLGPGCQAHPPVTCSSPRYMTDPGLASRDDGKGGAGIDGEKYESED